MNALIKKLIQRVEMLVVKAVLNAVDDSTQIQLVKLSALEGETQDGIERLQNYGLSSVPLKDSEALVAYLNGNRDHGVVIVCDSGDHRPTSLKDGEVIVYSKHGQSILLKEDGSILIEGATAVNIKDSEINLGSDVLPPTAGVVTGECLCAFTGAPHADYSAVVKAKKV